MEKVVKLVKELWYHTDTTNFIKELRKENGYNLFILLKADIQRTTRHSVLLGLLLIFMCVILPITHVSWVIILLLLNAYYNYIRIKAIEDFIKLCKSIVNFEDYCKVLLKLPNIDKQMLYQELQNLTSSFIYTQHNKSEWDTWLSNKLELFNTLFKQYEGVFCTENVIFFNLA
jgi:hypothetical protein